MIIITMTIVIVIVTLIITTTTTNVLIFPSHFILHCIYDRGYAYAYDCNCD